MKTVFLTCALYLYVCHSCAQDYKLYYSRIDSCALFFGQPQQADSIYARAFADFIGFPADYENAILAHYAVSGELRLDYVAGGFTGGLRKKELKDLLKSNAIPYKRSTLRHLYRDHRVKRSVKAMPILKLLRKDQRARRDYAAARETDSLNAIELVQLLQEKPELFDRQKTGWLVSEMVKILLLHQEFRDISMVFPTLRDFVQEGKMSRETLSLIIDRSSNLGNRFGIGPMGELSFIPGGNMPICPGENSYFYSNTGSFCPYFSHSGYILFPIDPRMSAKEVDALRAYLFLSPLEQYYSTYPFPRYTSEEFCQKIREGRAKEGKEP